MFVKTELASRVQALERSSKLRKARRICISRDESLGCQSRLRKVGRPAKRIHLALTTDMRARAPLAGPGGNKPNQSHRQVRPTLPLHVGWEFIDARRKNFFTVIEYGPATVTRLSPTKARRCRATERATPSISGDVPFFDHIRSPSFHRGRAAERRNNSFYPLPRPRASFIATLQLRNWTNCKMSSMLIGRSPSTTTYFQFSYRACTSATATTMSATGP